jgi:HPt (histidine-containing phosphotransfer) domain-containing protein
MAVLDLEHLKRIVGNDPAFIRQVLQIFLRNTPKDMEALIESVEKESHEQISFHAHKLKSAAGAIGYNQAYEDFKVLEAMSKEMAPIPEIKKKVDSLSAECMSCMVDIEKIMDSL